MAAISIPNDWFPRIHQVELWNYFQNGGTRGVAVWHRRAGKDSTGLNFTASEMFKRRGVYWHMLPTTVQARKVVWNGIDGEGRRIIDQVFPKEIRERTNNQEMLIETKFGSIWQLCGSDNYDSLVGSNPVGVIFSEFSIADPAAWDYIRPILVENGGWALFIFTPRGKNHGHRLYKMATQNPNWFSQLLTVQDTYRENGDPIVPEWAVDEERMAGMPEEKIQQEFYCSWEAGMEGALYTKQLAHASERGMHGHFPWNPDMPVVTVWDIGIRDKNVIGFFQKHPTNDFPVLVDSVHGRNIGLPNWIKIVKEKPYVYSAHFGPHDLEHREFGTGRRRLDIAEDLGFEFEIVPKLPLEDGIESTRSFIKRLYINTSEVQTHILKDSELQYQSGGEYVLDGLAAYRREWDEKKKIWTDKPVHDWASHPADMVRYASLVFNDDLFGFSHDRFKVIRAHRA